ncbi:peptidase S1 [Maricaulis sp.]|uniref:peptidase S1 n=1 Tax=Maricaulis sp. TaxID=1486257 RepID=UPI0025E1CB47|nr:peptidase S1 [Maricaulis sp.]MDF1768045.1 peptidase S1 [Maricaulis sp.]
MSIKTILAAGIAAASFAGVAAAQDWSLQPTFGTVNLNSGFQPDPYTTSITAGGTIQASNLSPSCAGMIANAPDFRLNFNAGSLPLYISAYSNADTTLVINGPDGSWYCNDDTNGLNPSVAWGSPDSGQYDIWIGTYGTNSDLASSTLHISELGG